MSTELTAEMVAQKRTNLVANAIGILEDKGIEALTLRHLSEVCNVSRTTPYLYFKNKAALLDAIRIHSLHELTGQCKLAVFRGDGPVEKMRNLSEALIKFALEHPELYKLVFVTGLNGKTITGEFCEALGGYREVTEAPMQQAYDDNLILLPPKRLSPVIWAAIHGMLMLKCAGLAGGNGNFKQLRSDLEQVLAFGFVTDRP